MHDVTPLGFRGHVRQISSIHGLIRDKHNLVVDACVELVAQALLGRDQIDAVLFGYSGGVIATPGLRTIYNPIYRAPVGVNSASPPFISKDELGYKSIITWTGVYVNPGPSNVSYDMLGLLSQNDRLFAATSIDTVTVAPNESIAVEWTIVTRGR